MNRNSLTVESAVSTFGAAATAKLSNLAAGGNPEDQLRAPFESLLRDMAALSERNNVVLIGESSLADLCLRPDYAVAVDRALAGFVELKAPGKGADPRRFTNPHDKEQGEKLRSDESPVRTVFRSALTRQRCGNMAGSKWTLISASLILETRLSSFCSEVRLGVLKEWIARALSSR